MTGRFSQIGIALNILSAVFFRFSWLYKCMLDDEIEKTIMAKNERVQPLMIGGSNFVA
jgi:hypothetical protein